MLSLEQQPTYKKPTHGRSALVTQENVGMVGFENDNERAWAELLLALYPELGLVYEPFEVQMPKMTDEGEVSGAMVGTVPDFALTLEAPNNTPLHPTEAVVVLELSRSSLECGSKQRQAKLAARAGIENYVQLGRHEGELVLNSSNPAEDLKRLTHGQLDYQVLNKLAIERSD